MKKKAQRNQGIAFLGIGLMGFVLVTYQHPDSDVSKNVYAVLPKVLPVMAVVIGLQILWFITRTAMRSKRAAGAESTAGAADKKAA